MGHTSFDLVFPHASSTAQRRGTLEFRTPTSDQISVLGLKLNGISAFSTIPQLPSWAEEGLRQQCSVIGGRGFLAPLPGWLASDRVPALRR